ncbi:hypothetical protein HPB51_000978 [Rhipicephalus microplus]|uniref:THAP-type domain-containing protein n=1 Tax=Rhipicephalus microplus TaxID=6941 RepID=A0A9J6DEF7_RHIMP|nr:hypothetical protein HPB51_000978 [Rhipicephalus microplus]
MPGCCCAPGCNSNYAHGPKARVYWFPMDADQRTAWTRATPRKDFAPTKYNVVCEKHFHASDFVTTPTYQDEKTGRVLEVPLQLRRLKSGAIPSLFSNCPSYLSRPTTVVREGPEEKRLCPEGESLQKAIRQSAEAHQKRRKRITSVLLKTCSPL